MRKKISVILSILLTFSMLMCLITACGSDDAPGTPETPSPPSEAPGASDPAEAPELPEPVNEFPFEGQTLTIGGWMGSDAELTALLMCIAEFSERTRATVTFIGYDDYNAQILEDIAYGKAPDALYVDGFHAQQFIDQGVLEPLDPETFNIEMFYSGAISAFFGDGILYAVPKDQSTLARYVNISLLEAVGLTVSDIPGKAEDYLTFLPELQSKLNKEFGAGKVVASTGMFELSRYLHWLSRDGGQPVSPENKVNLNDPRITAQIEFILSLFDTGGMKRPSDLSASWNGEAFGLEFCVIMEEGNWVYNYLRSEFPDVIFEVIDMPSYMGRSSSMSFASGWGINSDSPNKELAEAWILFKTGPEGMKIWCESSGLLPTRIDVAEDIASGFSPGLNVHVDQSVNAVAWNLGLHGDIISDTFISYSSSVLNKSISVTAFLETVTDVSNVLIGSR